MNIPQKLESPIVLPPESICQNWVSNNNFDLNQNLTLSFKINSENTSDKELGFGIFLVNSEKTDIFGATTVRGGLIDYSTKGEIGEGINIGGNKLIVNYNNEKYDLLLDHVYAYDKQSLVKNQNPFNVDTINNPNIVSIYFDSSKSIFKEYQDAYKNIYFDNFEVKDLISEEVVDPLSYISPLFLQVKQSLYALELPFDILNLNSTVLRFSFENTGKLLKIDILYPENTLYKPVVSKYLDLNLANQDNLKLAYLLASPIESYDISKQANFNIQEFHVQGKLK